MTEWVSVKDRLPDLAWGGGNESDDVLVNVRYNDGQCDIYVGYYQCGEWYTCMHHNTEKVDKEKGDTVTHWMEKPEPPHEA